MLTGRELQMLLDSWDRDLPIYVVDDGKLTGSATPLVEVSENPVEISDGHKVIMLTRETPKKPRIYVLIDKGPEGFRVRRAVISHDCMDDFSKLMAHFFGSGASRMGWRDYNGMMLIGFNKDGLGRELPYDAKVDGILIQLNKEWR